MISFFRTLAFLVLIGSVLVFPKGANAQEDDTASAEDIAIAFFKTAKITPDFEKWARGSNGFKTVAPAMVPEFLDKEKQRLARRWKAYDEQEHVFNVRTSAQVELKVNADSKGKEQYWMYLSFMTGAATYFPYSFQDYNFAVIPQRMDQLMIQPLERLQYEAIFKNFGESAKGSGWLYMQMKPAKAYADKPYEIDGMEQWALMADIVTMSLLSTDGTALWNYGASWYVSPKTRELQDLYKKREAPAYPSNP